MWKVKFEIEIDLLTFLCFLLAFWLVALIAMSFELPVVARDGATPPDVPPAG